MALVQKLNKQFEVPDYKLDEFLQLGYNLIDPETGKVAKYGALQDVESLKKENALLKAEIQTLKSTNESLIAENENLKKEVEAFRSLTEVNATEETKAEEVEVKLPTKQKAKKEVTAK